MCLWFACIMGVVTHFNDRRRKNDMFQEMQPFNIDDESLHLIEKIHLSLRLQENEEEEREEGGGTFKTKDSSSSSIAPSPLPPPKPSRRKFDNQYGTLFSRHNHQSTSSLSSLEEEKKQDSDDLLQSEDEEFRVDLVLELESYVVS